MDAAFIQLVLVGGLVVSAVWGLYAVARFKKPTVVYLWPLVIFWVIVIGFCNYVWKSGRESDERHYRESFPEMFDDAR